MSSEISRSSPSAAEAAAISSFAKPNTHSYFSVTRYLATGNTNGNLNYQLLDTAHKMKTIAAVALGGLADLTLHVLSLGALAIYVAYKNYQIAQFNALPEIEQAAKTLEESTDRCIAAAQAYQKTPDDHQKNIQLRDAIRETGKILQLNRFTFPESADEFEELVRDKITSALEGQLVTIRPHHRGDAHFFDYPLAELVLNGFYPTDSNGVSNPHLQGVSPSSITFRFEDGIFAPSKEAILDIFYAQSGVDLHRAIRALTKNLDSIQRPEKKDREQIRKDILREIQSKMEDKTSPKFARMAEGAARYIDRDNRESKLGTIREAIFQTGLKNLCKQLAKDGLLSEDRQGPLKSAIQRLSERSSTAKKIANGVKALTYVTVAGAAASKAPVVGPLVTNAAGHAANAISKGIAMTGASALFGASKTVDMLGSLGGLYSPELGAKLQTIARTGGQYASRAAHSGLGMAGAAGRFVHSGVDSAMSGVGSAMTGVANQFPAASNALSTAATTAAPYALPAAAAVVAGACLYKAYRHATASSLTQKEQIQNALTKASDDRKQAEQVFKHVKKIALELPSSAEQQEAIQNVRVQLKEAEEAYSSAIGAQARANAASKDRSQDMDQLNRAYTKAKTAQQKAAQVQQVAEQLQTNVEQVLAQENKLYVDLDGQFKRAFKILKAVDRELHGFGRAMTSNDKRKKLEQKLSEATALLAKFEKTKLVQVEQELREVAELEAQIQAALQQQLTDPSKKYDEKLNRLRAEKEQRARGSQELMDQYQHIKSEIERLTAEIAHIQPSQS